MANSMKRTNIEDSQLLPVIESKISVQSHNRVQHLQLPDEVTSKDGRALMSLAALISSDLVLRGAQKQAPNRASGAARQFQQMKHFVQLRAPRFESALLIER